MDVNKYGVKYLRRHEYDGYAKDLAAVVQTKNMTPKRIKPALKRRAYEKTGWLLANHIRRSANRPGILRRWKDRLELLERQTNSKIALAKSTGLTWHRLVPITFEAHCIKATEDERRLWVFSRQEVFGRALLLSTLNREKYVYVSTTTIRTMRPDVAQLAYGLPAVDLQHAITRANILELLLQDTHVQEWATSSKHIGQTSVAVWERPVPRSF